MRRTLERSQRVEQRQKRWSWGGLSADQDGRAGRRSLCFYMLFLLLGCFWFLKRKKPLQTERQGHQMGQISAEV